MARDPYAAAANPVSKANKAAAAAAKKRRSDLAKRVKQKKSKPPPRATPRTILDAMGGTPGIDALLDRKPKPPPKKTGPPPKISHDFLGERYPIPRVAPYKRGRDIDNTVSRAEKMAVVFAAQERLDPLEMYKLRKQADRQREEALGGVFDDMNDPVAMLRRISGYDTPPPDVLQYMSDKALDKMYKASLASGLPLSTPKIERDKATIRRGISPDRAEQILEPQPGRVAKTSTDRGSRTGLPRPDLFAKKVGGAIVDAVSWEAEGIRDDVGNIISYESGEFMEVWKSLMGEVFDDDQLAELQQFAMEAVETSSNWSEKVAEAVDYIAASYDRKEVTDPKTGETKVVYSGVGAGVGEVVHNLVRNVGEVSFGLAPGTLYAIVDPKSAARDMGALYTQFYGPLAEHDWGTFLDNVREHPLQLPLDLLMVAQAGTAGKGIVGATRRNLKAWGEGQMLNFAEGAKPMTLYDALTFGLMRMGPHEVMPGVVRMGREVPVRYVTARVSLEEAESDSVITLRDVETDEVTTQVAGDVDLEGTPLLEDGKKTRISFGGKIYEVTDIVGEVKLTQRYTPRSETGRAISDYYWNRIRAMFGGKGVRQKVREQLEMDKARLMGPIQHFLSASRRIERNTPGRKGRRTAFDRMLVYGEDYLAEAHAELARREDTPADKRTRAEQAEIDVLKEAIPILENPPDWMREAATLGRQAARDAEELLIDLGWLSQESADAMRTAQVAWTEPRVPVDSPVRDHLQQIMFQAYKRRKNMTDSDVLGRVNMSIEMVDQWARAWGRILDTDPAGFYEKMYREASVVSPEEMLAIVESDPRILTQRREAKAEVAAAAEEVTIEQALADVERSAIASVRQYEGRNVRLQNRIVEGTKKLLADLPGSIIRGWAAKDWYQRSGEGMLQAANGNKQHAEALAAVTALFSPQTMVGVDLAQAIETLAIYHEHHVPGKTGEDYVTEAMTNRPGAKKAQEALDLIYEGGGITEEWMWEHGGWSGEDSFKTRGFFLTFVKYMDYDRYKELLGARPHPVVLDRWMNVSLRLPPEMTLTGLDYIETQKVFSNIAERLNLEPDMLQAIIWTDYRHRVARKLEPEHIEEVTAGADYSHSFAREATARINYELVPGDPVLQQRYWALSSRDRERFHAETTQLIREFLEGVPLGGRINVRHYGIYDGASAPNWQIVMPVGTMRSGRGKLKPVTERLVDQVADELRKALAQDSVGHMVPFVKAGDTAPKAWAGYEVTLPELSPRIMIEINEEMAAKGFNVVMAPAEGNAFWIYALTDDWSRAITSGTKTAERFADALDALFKERYPNGGYTHEGASIITKLIEEGTLELPELAARGRTGAEISRRGALLSERAAEVRERYLGDNSPIALRPSEQLAKREAAARVDYELATSPLGKVQAQVRKTWELSEDTYYAGAVHFDSEGPVELFLTQDEADIATLAHETVHAAAPLWADALVKHDPEGAAYLAEQLGLEVEVGAVSELPPMKSDLARSFEAGFTSNEVPGMRRPAVGGGEEFAMAMRRSELLPRLIEAWFRVGRSPAVHLRWLMDTLGEPFREAYASARSIARSKEEADLIFGEKGQQNGLLHDPKITELLSLLWDHAAGKSPDAEVVFVTRQRMNSFFGEGADRVRTFFRGAATPARRSPVKKGSRMSRFAGGEFERGPKVVAAYHAEAVRIEAQRVHADKADGFSIPIEVVEGKPVLNPGYRIWIYEHLPGANAKINDLLRRAEEDNGSASGELLLDHEPEEALEIVSATVDKGIAEQVPKDFETVRQQLGISDEQMMEMIREGRIKQVPDWVVDSYRDGTTTAWTLETISAVKQAFVLALSLPSLIARWNMILKPAYPILNAANAEILGWLSQGFLHPFMMRHVTDMTSSLPPHILRRMDLGIGTSADIFTLSDVRPRTAVEAAVRKEQEWFSKGIHIASVPEKRIRRSAIMAELWKYGLRSAEDVTRFYELVDSGKHPELVERLNQMERWAEESMIRFRGLTPPEQNLVRHFFFVYGWLRASTRFMVFYPLNFPILAGISNAIGQVGWEKLRSELEAMPISQAGAMPRGKAKKEEGEFLQKVLDLSPLLQFTTPAQVADAVWNSGFSSGQANTVASFLSPSVEQGLTFVYGENPKWGGSFIDGLKNTFSWRQMPVLSWVSRFMDPSSTQTSIKAPLDVWGVAQMLFMGQMVPRDIKMSKAFDQWMREQPRELQPVYREGQRAFELMTTGDQAFKLLGYGGLPEEISRAISAQESYGVFDSVRLKQLNDRLRAKREDRLTSLPLSDRSEGRWKILGALYPDAQSQLIESFEGSGLSQSRPADRPLMYAAIENVWRGVVGGQMASLRKVLKAAYGTDKTNWIPGSVEWTQDRWDVDG